MMLGRLAVAPKSGKHRNTTHDKSKSFFMNGHAACVSFARPFTTGFILHYSHGVKKIPLKPLLLPKQLIGNQNATSLVLKLLTQPRLCMAINGWVGRLN